MRRSPLSPTARLTSALLATVLLGACASVAPATVDSRAIAPTAIPAHGVTGVSDAHLTPEFWVSRLRAPDAPILDRAQIDALNARLFAMEPSMHDLAALPATIDGGQVRQWLDALSSRPTTPRYGMDGNLLADATLDAMQRDLARDRIPANQPTRYALVTRRADMRAFPGELRAFSRAGDHDIDRFQETTLFPGDPVVPLHASRDGRWLFVLAERYPAWVEADAIAVGTREQVLGYGRRTPYRIITGGKVRTVYTPEAPAVSEVQLEMGNRYPLANLPPDVPVNGQHPYTAWTLELPVRSGDGALAFSPALLPKIADSREDYLPLTRANLVRQSFKFLGERYGWGHDYNGRDCSGFVSEIYRSMGVQLPRNTSRQSVTQAFERTAFTAESTAAQREAAMAALDVGDMIFIPGHVMMVIGRIGNEPYVIHDTNGGSVLDADGNLRALRLNGVSVNPLRSLRFNAQDSYIDRITNIVHIR